MEDHPRVLQERVEVRAVHRGREKAQERIRGRNNEEEEPEGDERKRPKNARKDFFRELARGEGHGGHPPAERRHPEENGALVRAPDRRQLVVPGQQQIGVSRNVDEREVARHERIGKRADGDRCADGESDRRGSARAHPAPDVERGARDRQDAACSGDDERENEGELPDLGSHSFESLWRKVAVMSAPLRARGTALSVRRRRESLGCGVPYAQKAPLFITGERRFFADGRPARRGRAFRRSGITSSVRRP